MTRPGGALDDLRRERPEWAPWLAVVEETLRETASGRWDAAVPTGIHADQAATPLLAGATLSLQSRAIRRLFERLVGVASAGGTPKMRTVEAALTRDLDAPRLFEIALCQDGVRLKEMADACGADAEALQAVAALVPVPFLQACQRRLASAIRESWMEGYCPVCGAWPAFAEVRGIERTRHFRCGRCGAGWHARALCCPYCGLHDHDELVTLVPEKQDSHGVIDACRRCLGYVKTFTTLQGCPPDAVMLEDLASVALDVAALEDGYVRPPDAGYALGVTVAADGSSRRFLAWGS